MWEESLLEANGFQKEIGSCDGRYFLLLGGGGGGGSGKKPCTLGKFPKKQLAVCTHKNSTQNYSILHTYIYRPNGVYDYSIIIDNYQECFISRANFAIFLFPGMLDYIIQIPAVTKHVYNHIATIIKNRRR